MAAGILLHELVITSSQTHAPAVLKSKPTAARLGLLPYTCISNDAQQLKFGAAAAQQLVKLPSTSDANRAPRDDVDARAGQGSDTPALRSSDDKEAHLSYSSGLISSPYREIGHLLDLELLDNDQDRLLALALSHLKPATEDYATAEYAAALNWEEVVGTLKTLTDLESRRWTERTYYVVYFRSQLQANVDNDKLHTLDKESHLEAAKSGGLLKYWFGCADAQRRNLATCRFQPRLGQVSSYHLDLLTA